MMCILQDMKCYYEACTVQYKQVQHTCMHINKILSFKTKRTGEHLPKTGRSSETRHLDQKTQDSLRVSSITDTHFKSAPDKLHEVVYLRHLV